ncbi:hypothetical protein VNO78_15619 [Psophocarpus tetragonolobus]|uniref:Uncharacterized protein n=1 Tax=Psophocarpus tetragonolobus TaxID=3891 RepID=A0AAN9SFB1_PSOTE
MDEGEKNLDVLYFKRHRKLNFNAPLLSTKRICFSGVADTSFSSSLLDSTVLNTSVPFSWEQAPGKPKTMERSDNIYDGDIDTPRLRPPPCLWHPLQEAAKTDASNDVLAFDQDNGCDGDDEGDDKKNDVYTNAMDDLSLSEASDIMQQSEAAHDDSNLRLKLAEFNGGQSPTYMINRFLPDANALVASSSVHFSNDDRVCDTFNHEGHLKGSTRHSYACSTKGCGLEFLFSWLMRNKLCAIKSPVLSSYTNVQNHRHSSKHKNHRSSADKPCKNVSGRSVHRSVQNLNPISGQLLPAFLENQSCLIKFISHNDSEL